MPIFDADGHITETTEQVAKYLDDPYRQRSATYGLYTADGWDRRMINTLGDWGGDAKSFDFFFQLVNAFVVENAPHRFVLHGSHHVRHGGVRIQTADLAVACVERRLAVASFPAPAAAGARIIVALRLEPELAQIPPAPAAGPAPPAPPVSPPGEPLAPP